MFHIGGRDLEHTRKLANVCNGNQQVSLVVDDLQSRSPRFVRVYGTAEEAERHGAFGAGTYLRIVPTVSWSWNLWGAPYGAENNSDRGTRRTRHDA